MLIGSLQGSSLGRNASDQSLETHQFDLEAGGQFVEWLRRVRRHEKIYSLRVRLAEADKIRSVEVRTRYLAFDREQLHRGTPHHEVDRVPMLVTPVLDRARLQASV